MNEHIDTLISKLIALRLSKGISQRQLSIMTGVSHVVISRLESKKQAPHISTLNKLLNAMDARLTIEEIPKGEE